MARFGAWWKTPEEHLRENVDLDQKTKCRIWRGPRSGDGYGEIKVGPCVHAVHRVAYELTFGPVPAGMVVRHRCKQPLCVNPAHLEAGTAELSATDKVASGQASSKSGRKLSTKAVARVVRLRRLGAKLSPMAGSLWARAG